LNNNRGRTAGHGRRLDTADVKVFDEVASHRDTMRLTHYDERVIDQLAAYTQLTGAETVVDVGTGTGVPRRLLCREAGARPCAPPHRPKRLWATGYVVVACAGRAGVSLTAVWM
jgi:hypothetical protein